MEDLHIIVLVLLEGYLLRNLLRNCAILRKCGEVIELIGAASHLGYLNHSR
jgi:hypothetical protein